MITGSWPGDLHFGLKLYCHPAQVGEVRYALEPLAKLSFSPCFSSGHRCRLNPGNRFNGLAFLPTDVERGSPQQTVENGYFTAITPPHPELKHGENESFARSSVACREQDMLKVRTSPARVSNAVTTS